MNAAQTRAQCEQSLARRPAPSKRARSHQRRCQHQHRARSHVCVHAEASRRVEAQAATLAPQATVHAAFPRGAEWSVHKFGGTCVSAAERISEAAEVLTKVRSPLERSLSLLDALSVASRAVAALRGHSAYKHVVCRGHSVLCPSCAVAAWACSQARAHASALGLMFECRAHATGVASCCVDAA